MKRLHILLSCFFVLLAFSFKAQADSVVISGELKVTGRLKVGDNNDVPVKGSIRWNDTANDFEGFNGKEWLSLTSAGTRNDLQGAVDGLGGLKNYTPATSSDGTASDVFGCAVALSGDFAIIGARAAENSGGVSTGAAYIFKRQGATWIEHQKLLSSDGASGDFFGISVDMYGAYAIIGATGDDDHGSGSGSVYIFKRTGSIWSQYGKLTASDAAPGDAFGNAVAIFQNRMIIGAVANDDHGSSSGSAYIFVEGMSSWTEDQKISASDAAAGDRFGTSVDLTEDNLIVSGYPTGFSSGSAYVFTYNGTSWLEQDILDFPPSLPTCPGFGVNVSISDDIAFVGAHLDTTFMGLEILPSVYIFKRTGTMWNLTKTVSGLDGSEFGFRCNYREPYLIVSATKDGSVTGCDEAPVVNTGKVFIFKYINGIFYEHLTVSDPLGASGDLFGTSVCVDGSDILIGAQGADPGGISGQGTAMFAKIE